MFAWLPLFQLEPSLLLGSLPLGWRSCMVDDLLSDLFYSSLNFLGSLNGQGSAPSAQRHNPRPWGTHCQVGMREPYCVRYQGTHMALGTEIEIMIGDRNAEEECLVQSRQVSWRKMSLNWASRICGAFSKRRGEGRIIPGGKQTTSTPNWLEKRVCVCQYHRLSASEGAFCWPYFTTGSQKQHLIPVSWSWVSGEIKTCVSQKQSKGYLHIQCFSLRLPFRAGSTKFGHCIHFLRLPKKPKVP